MLDFRLVRCDWLMTVVVMTNIATADCERIRFHSFDLGIGERGMYMTGSSWGLVGRSCPSYTISYVGTAGLMRLASESEFSRLRVFPDLCSSMFDDFRVGRTASADYMWCVFIAHAGHSTPSIIASDRGSLPIDSALQLQA